MEQAEDGSDAVVIAHGAELREECAAVGGAARAVANGGEEAAFGFLLSEDDVLITWFEIVAAVAVVAAGEDVDIGGVGAGETLIDVEMVADDGRVAVGLGGNRRSDRERRRVLRRHPAFGPAVLRAPIRALMPPGRRRYGVVRICEMR